MQKISVLLPVKNGEKYVAESIDSVLDQSYSEFELLIFDDNSCDHTLEIIKDYKDSRIKIFTGRNGFIANLNMGIEISRGEYIARMDADDIMNPFRLECQLSVMENSTVDVCGSSIIIFGEGIEPYVHYNFTGTLENAIVLKLLGFCNIMSHPSVMLRRDFLIKHNLRYQKSPYTEDYRLWFEIAKLNGVFHTIPQPLLAYRMSNEQVTKIHQQEMGENVALIHKEVKEYLQAISEM